MDSEKYKIIWMDKSQPDKDLIVAQIIRFNNGKNKLGLVRGKKVGDKWIYARLGTLTKKEALALFEHIRRALSTNLIEE